MKYDTIHSAKKMHGTTLYLIYFYLVTSNYSGLLATCGGSRSARGAEESEKENLKSCEEILC